MKGLMKQQSRFALLWLFALAGLLLFGARLPVGLAAEEPEGEKAEASYEVSTGDPVVGAVLQLLSADGSVVAEMVTDGEDIVLDAELIAGETYTLREVSAPAGFVKADDIVFTVSEDGSVDEIVMKDAPTTVKVYKKDARDRFLAGATLQILDKDGNVIEEWKSTEEPHVIAGKLIAGETYTLHEVSAPEGYLRADDQTFTVSADGSIDRLTVYNMTSVTPQTGEDDAWIWRSVIAGLASLTLFVGCGLYLSYKKFKEEQEREA